MLQWKSLSSAPTTYHYLGKEEGMPEGGYGIHITPELKGPDKRRQVQKEGLQIIVLMTDT